MFASVSIAEEDGHVSSSTETAPVNRFRRSNILVVTALVVGCVFAFSAIRQPGGAFASADMHGMETFYATMKSLNIDLEHMDLKKTLNTSNMPKENVDRLLAFRRKLFANPVANRGLKTATCVLDITQGTYFVERAALAITAATASCQGGSAHVQAACAADIAGVYASFAFVAEFISSAVSQCAILPDIQADCSRAISGLVANTGRIAVTAATMAGTCSKGAAFDKPISDSVWQMTRRLQGQNALHGTYDDRGMEIATCALDVPQAATYLAMFGVAIDRASRRCTRQRMNFWTKKDFRRFQRGQVLCAADIFEILEALSMAGAFVSSAASHCAPATNQQALCASGALGVVGGITGLTKSALLTDSGCSLIPVFPPIPPFPPTDKCPHKPKQCPAVWALPTQKPCCPPDGVCKGAGRVCICDGDALKTCKDGATCYATGSIGKCDTTAKCCATEKIDKCTGASACTSPEIKVCKGQGTECVEQGW